MALPTVGAQITLQNVQQFNAACQSAIQSLNFLNKTLQTMASNTGTATAASSKNVTSFLGTLGKASSTASSEVNKSFSAIGKATQQVSGIIVASMTAATASVVGLGTASFVMGAEFVQNVVNAGVAVDATNQDLSDMSDITLELSRRWNISNKQLQENLGSYTRAGGSIEDLKAGVYEYIVGLTAASAGELSLNQAIMMVTGSQGAFNIHGKETIKITNGITAAANASAISYKDLFRTVPQAAAVFAGMGFTFEDLMTVTALLGQEYLRNSDAGTAMKQMVISLLNPSKKATEAMKEYGISLFDDQGNALDLIDVVRQLNKAFGQIDESLPDETIMNMKTGQALAQIFGADALRPALILAKRGPEAFAKMQLQIEKTSSENISKKMLEPASNQFKILTNQVEAFGIMVGQQTEPAFRSLLTDANLFLQTITPGQIGMIGKAFASMITGVGFDKLGEQASKVFSGDILRAFDSFVNLLYTIRDVVTNQIIPSFNYLVNSITDGANAAYVLSEVFDSISQSVQTFADVVTAVNVVIGDLINYIKQTTIGAIALEIIFKGILALPFVTLIAVFIAIGAAISQLLGPVLLVSLAVGAVIYAFENWNDIIAIVNGVVDSIVRVFGGIVETIQGIIQPVIDVVSNAFKSILSVVQPIINSFVKFIVDNFGYIEAFVAAVFLEMAARAALSAIFIAQQFAMMIVPAIISAGSTIIPIIGTIILQFAAMATAAIASAAATVAAFVAGIVPAVTAAMAAVIAALSSVLIPIAILAAVAAGLYLAWKTNFLGIQDFVGKVLTWVSTKIAEFINWIKSLPVIGQFVEGVANSINLIGGGVSDAFDSAKTSVTGFVDEARKGIEKYTGDLKGSLPAMDDFQKKIDEIKKSNQDAGDAAQRAREAQQRWDEQNKTEAGKKPIPKPGFPEDTDGKTESKADKLKALTAEIMRALKDLPIMTQALGEFLAKLAEDAPERLQPMLRALLSSKETLQSIVALKKEILKIDLELVQIGIRQQYLQAQIAAIEAKESLVRMQYARQLLDLQTAQAALDLQIIPIRQRISDIDSEINKLQRENLVLVRQRAEAEIALLPFKKQLLAIDQQIQDLQWKNYNQLIAQAEAEYSILPVKQRVAQIEKQITDTVNRRLQLQQEESELLAQRQLTLLDRQLKATNKQLDAAWQKMDIAEILKLEDQNRALEDQRSAAEDNLDNIQAQIEDQKFLEDITINRLEQEKLRYEELIKPTEDYLFNLKQQMELQQAGIDLAILRLEAERQSIEQLMQPYKNIIDNLNFEIEAEKTRNQLRILDLQMEKQALEDMLEPLERLRQSYQTQIDLINAQITVKNYAYELQKLQYEQMNAMEEVRRTELEATKSAIDILFTDLVMQYTNALAASGAFSRDEALEVAKRLGIWNEQIAKLQEVVSEFSHIKDEADNVTDAINAIPKNIDIYITTHYQSTGTPSSASAANTNSNVPSMAEGGRVPGPWGKPILIEAHGGEYISGLRNIVPTSVNMAQSRAPARASTTNYNTSYNVDANYANMQSPASIRMDLQALAAKTRR